MSSRTSVSDRLAAVDAVRGIAMFGVCLSHFGIGIQLAWPRLAAALWVFGMYASPTFVITSGAMLGLLLHERSARTHERRRLLVDRALFMLTVGHLVISGAHIERMNAFSDEFSLLFITDTISAAILVGAYIVPRLSAAQRLLLAGVVYTVSWSIVLLWHPESPAGLALKSVLVGNVPVDGAPPQTFSLVPWFAVYLGGTVVGNALVNASAEGHVARFARRLVAGGVAGLALAVLIKLSYYVIRPSAWASYEAMPPFWHGVYLLTSPFDKFPPGPAYLAFFGGCGSILAGTILWSADKGLLRRFVAFAAVVGRASFVVYAVQFYFYYLLVAHLPQSHGWMLALYLTGTLAVLWITAWAWDHWAGNKYLTVGLRRVRWL